MSLGEAGGTGIYTVWHFVATGPGRNDVIARELVDLDLSIACMRGVASRLRLCGGLRSVNPPLESQTSMILISIETRPPLDG